MLKTRFLFVILLAIIFTGCTNNKGKTEIKIQLSEAEYLFSLPGYEKDSTFWAAYQQAQKEFNPEKEEFLSLFENKLLELEPNCRLAAYFGTIEFKDKINFDSSNPEVVAVLTEAIKSANENTIRVLEKRIESACKTTSFLAGLFDKPSVVVKNLPEKNTYSFIINRKVDKVLIKKLLESQGDFGLWETYSSKELWEYISAANNIIKENIKSGNAVNIGIANTSIDGDNQLFSILKPSFPIATAVTSGDIIGVSSVKDTALVDKYLAIPDVKSWLPRNLMLLWSLNHADINRDSSQLIAVRNSTRDQSALINGDVIVKAKAQISKKQAAVLIELNGGGSKILSRITRDNISKQIAVVLDNIVVFNPYINYEINGGIINISGSISSEEANYLASILNGGTKPKISVQVLDINETIE